MSVCVHVARRVCVRFYMWTCSAAGFSGCLGKPFTVSGLRRVLTGKLDRSWFAIVDNLSDREEVDVS